jgi:hypothetical protein
MKKTIQIFNINNEIYKLSIFSNDSYLKINKEILNFKYPIHAITRLHQKTRRNFQSFYFLKEETEILRLKNRRYSP